MDSTKDFGLYINQNLGWNNNHGQEQLTSSGISSQAVYVYNFIPRSTESEFMNHLGVVKKC